MGAIRVLTLVALIFLALPLVQAEEVYRQGDPINFIEVIRLNGFPDDSILANVTVTDPNNAVLLDFIAMTYNTTTKLFNFTLQGDNTTILGDYQRCVTASGGGLNKTTCFVFEVTPTGASFTTAKSIIYSIGFVLALFLFSISLFGAIKLPFRDTVDDQGLVVGINDLKYIKIFLWFMSYVTLTFIAFLVYNICFGFLNFPLLSSFFKFVFWLLISFMLPVLIVFMLVAIVNFLTGKKLKEALNRGIALRP